jgi:cytochrome c biogenesis protein CcmG/thiol:disulfide interchange protein DsbE
MLNMNSSSPPPVPSSSAPAARSGFAIACLILGVFALLGSLIVVGALFGVTAIVLGMIHLSRRQTRNGMAWAGVALSLAGIALSVGFGVFYFNTGKKVFKQMHEEMERMGAQHDAWKGVIAPDFAMTTLEGKTIKLSELKGKRVIIDFWATWCPPCVMEIPHFIELRKQVSGDELVIVGISDEDAETLKPFVKKKGINYPIASADDLPAPYNDVTSIPTTFFIDRNGVIQEVLVGYHDLEQLKLHATAEDYEGEPKTQPETQEGGSVEAEQPAETGDR